MNLRLFQLVQVISLAALAWFAYVLLNRVHPLLVFAVIFVAACNATIVWMLRFNRSPLARLYRQPYIQQYVQWVCRWAGEQPPLEPPTSAPHADFLLHSDDDFRDASWRAKQIVFGHDPVIEQFLLHIRDGLVLRKRRRDGVSLPPLGSFLLVGGEGIGKRYLARVMAKLLYRDGEVLAFECDKLNQGWLLGSPGHSGPLLESVRRQPYQLILLERIDAAPPSVLQELQPLLTRGSCRDPSTGREISFQNTVVVMTTTKARVNLGILAAKLLNDRVWHDRAAEAMCSETGLDSAVLHAVEDIILCQQPTDEDKQRVTAALMLKECQNHGLQLTQVDPLIIASEVLRIEDNIGFGRLPQDVKKLLSKPILAASQRNSKSLSLRVRLPRSPAQEQVHD